MASVPDPYLTSEQYLSLERQAESKSEYFDGRVYAMAGASERHNLIVANLIATIRPQLRGTACRIYPSDLKVRVGTRYFYPDASVICGPTQFDGDGKDVVLNPTVLFEVLSESTMAFDRGPKFLTYQQIPSLEDYVLVSQDEPLVEHFQRYQQDRWIYAQASGREAVLELPSIRGQLRLDELYADI